MNFFYYMTRTKPNFTVTGNTIKGKEISKWVHKPNNKPKPRQKKPTNHSQSQPNPLPLTQPQRNITSCVSHSGHPQQKFQRPMDHPDQANNGKPVHALVDLDTAISAHAGSRSAVAGEVHELLMPQRRCSRKLIWVGPRDLASGQLDCGQVGPRSAIKDFVGDLGSAWEFIKEWNGMEWNNH